MPSFLRVVMLAELDRRNAEMMVRIARETATADEPVRTAQRATLASDKRRLRGLPCVSKGVSGAIPGTSPHHRY